jgi:hypothetical protein
MTTDEWGAASAWSTAFSVDVIVPDPDLRAHWVMDENAGTDVFDVTANLNNGTLDVPWVDAPVWTTGHSGAGLFFDASNGVEDKMLVPASASLKPTGPTAGLTVAARVNFTTTPAWTGIVDKAGAGGYLLGLAASNQGYFEIFAEGIAGTTAINDGAWHQIVGTWEQGTRIMRLYVDGQPQSSRVTSFSNLDALNDLGLVIGIRSGWGTPYAFTGTLDDVRIYGRALNGTEVQALFEE